ncbi:transmembrane protein 82 [Lepisosteus oculatus]|uniref:transmembrane protein 82 n=1 Tax=Lepisosteus oculatus TaxID=7918 RepID=UPI003721F61F
MLSVLRSWLPALPGVSWLSPGTATLDSLLQGLVGACGISVLCNLLRVHAFIKGFSDPGRASGDRVQLHRRGGFMEAVQLWVLTAVLGVVGSRVAALVVLEFSLRAVSARLMAVPEALHSSQLLVQCQFSLGCALTCSLSFLQEGAPQSTLSLALSAGLAGLLCWHTRSLWGHVGTMYKLHSSQRYCGVCVALLTWSHAIPGLLRRALALAFLVAAVAALSLINRDFLSAADALRFWTPLTICYTLLVIYMQEEQQHRPGGQAVFQTVVVRLGGLLVLMLTVGRWGDVLHILVCFLGEGCCLLRAWDLLTAHQTQEAELGPTRGSPGPRKEGVCLRGCPEVAQASRKDKDL